MSVEQSVIPMLAYEDGVAALDWLCAAFGFTEKEKWVEDGRLTHGEVRSESGGVIMLAQPTPDYEGPARHREHCAAAARWSQVPWVVNGVLVYVANVDAHYRRAAEHGARILSEVETGFPGKRYRCEDLEGQRWMFMETPAE
ncbi:MAG: VOC family protein [Asticcacaulis sp.]